MSWIVPSLAAEMWGVPLDQVIRGIQEGSIASRHEHGFVFVRWGEHHEPQAAAPAMNNTVMAATAKADAIAVAPATTVIAPAPATVMSPQYMAGSVLNSPDTANQNVTDTQIAAIAIRPGDSTTGDATKHDHSDGAHDGPHDGHADEESDSPQADHDYLNFLQHTGDWRRARREAAKLRQPPISQPKSKAA